MTPGLQPVKGSGFLLFVGIVILLTGVIYGFVKMLPQTERHTKTSMPQSVARHDVTKEYTLQPGQSVKITIPPNHLFRVYSKEIGMKLIDWRGQDVSDGWLGDDILHANFTAMNNGQSTAVVTVIMRPK